MVHFNSDNKVIQLNVEPDLSDTKVMNALRDAIKHSKSTKCKSVFILLIPEDETIDNPAFIRMNTRPNVRETVRLLEYLNVSLMLINDYIKSVLDRLR